MKKLESKELGTKELDDGNTGNDGIEVAQGGSSGIGNACGQWGVFFAGIGARVGAKRPRSSRNPVRSAAECVSYRSKALRNVHCHTRAGEADRVSGVRSRFSFS